MQHGFGNQWPPFTTASRCDFDLIKLWAELLCSILIQPRFERQHQRHRQTSFSYLDVSWTVCWRAAYCLQPFPSLSSLCRLPRKPVSWRFIFHLFLTVLRACFFSAFSSPWTHVFCSTGLRTGDAVSLLHLHLHLSGKRAFRGDIDFTPTQAHQRS